MSPCELQQLCGPSDPEYHDEHVRRPCQGQARAAADHRLDYGLAGTSGIHHEMPNALDEESRKGGRSRRLLRWHCSLAGCTTNADLLFVYVEMIRTNLISKFMALTQEHSREKWAWKRHVDFGAGSNQDRTHGK